MPPPFQNKVALITGAGSGIGRASALAFSGKGARVVVSDIDAKGMEETVSLIRESGGEAVSIQTDVTREDQVKLLIEKTVSAYGRLDFAHNNAGVRGRRVRLTDFSEKSWDEILNVNLKGVWLCMKYEIPEMIKQGGGAIVNTSSVAGVQGLPKLAAYVASKHGVIGLTRTAALEYIRQGVRINAVCPGLIDTPMIQRTVYGKIRATSPLRRLIRNTKKIVGYKFLAMQQPSGRMGSSEEVAEAVVWLCSDSASFVNGHSLVVDGGLVVN